MVFLTWPFFQSGNEGNLLSANFLFHVTAWPFYALLYLLPSLVIVKALQGVFRQKMRCVKTLSLLTTSASLIFIWCDGMIFQLYSFHINRFVLNLVFTDGGIESLNSTTSTYIGTGTVILRILLIQGVLLTLATKPFRVSRLLSKPGPAHIATFFFALFLVQGVSYGIGDLTNNAGVLEHAYDYPYFQKIRFRTLAEKFGFKTESRTQFTVTTDNGRLNYPLHKVSFDAVENPPNIVWLVAESLRWDQLTPAVMPNTLAFADKSWNFQHHYSSGNGTREGMFGMFYGLYGSYWDRFLHAGQSPLVMDRLQALGYTFDIRTGAKFTYPEFDRTILANIPETDFIEADANLTPWLRDEENTSAMIAFLEEEHSSPFMTFQFFESTHAPYFFPEKYAIREDYLRTMNYADFSKEYLKENMNGILARYRNAGHWVDRQVGRILDTLEQQNLLKNTIVIITGDHGEEFMEKGNWGHNSTFVDEQTRVPFVLYLPDQAPRKIDSLSSHLDIATTLLYELGAGVEAQDYSLGVNLLNNRERDSINISDWHSIAVVTSDMKIRIPYISTGFDRWTPTDAVDHPLDDGNYNQTLAHNQQIITRAIKNTTLFTK